MISPATIRKWFPTPTEELEQHFARRWALRREHRRIERELHGRGK